MPTKPKRNYQPEAGAIDQRDVFQTPPYAVDPLVPYLQAAGVRTVWESAAGQGYLACWLDMAGFAVIETDLDRGQDRFVTQRDADAEVTNVPFSLKYRYTWQACQDNRPFALLMPSDALFAGSEMWPLIDRYNLQWLLPEKRIDYKAPTAGWLKSCAQMHTCWVTRYLNLPSFVTRVKLAKPGRQALNHLAPLWDAWHADYVARRDGVAAEGPTVADRTIYTPRDFFALADLTV